MKYWMLVFALFTLAGCEKNINFTLNEREDVLVVDAQIENDQPPVVILTRSLSYFSNINPELIANTFVHNAVVTLSNGTQTQRLREYQFDILPGVSLFTYSLDEADPQAFRGEVNRRYDLRIEAGGKLYTASTSIPDTLKKPDSLWWTPAPFQEDTTRIILMVRSTDPPGLGNYIRYFTRKNSGNFLPGENSVFDDQVIDGTSYELQVQPGIDRNNRVLWKDNFFNRGDTITLKLSNIDRQTYRFWNTWEFAYQSIGNPFAQPNKVTGNISNGALGAFYGYGSVSRTLIVPR